MIDFPSRHLSERDVEIPLLLDFVREHPDIKRVLDVGCAKAFYAQELSELVPHLFGIDLIKDHDITKYFEDYIVGNALELKKRKFDLVSAVSVVEHFGVKHETGDDYELKQLKLVEKIGELAKRYVFISFPFGQGKHFLGSHSVVHKEQLAKFSKALKGFKLTKEFYSRLHAPEGQSWGKVSQEVAKDVVHDSHNPVSCICILKGVK